MPKPHKVLSLADLPKGQGKCVTVNGKQIAVFHQPDGFFAIDDECPHRGGSLSNGWIKDGLVSCPLHQWQFSLNDGSCPMIPTAKVSTYHVEVKDGSIWISV